MSDRDRPGPLTRALGWACDHVLWLVVAACVLTTGASLLYAHHQQEARRDAELGQDSLEAVLDTTRLVYTGWLDRLQDTASIYQRRAVQLEGDLEDEIARRLELETRARADVELHVATRETRGLPSPEPVEVEGETRIASVHYREEPFTADITARVPPPPDTASWDVSLALDAIHLALSVGCGEAPEGRKIRPVQVNVAAPRWASVRLDSVQTSAAVCNPRGGEGWRLFGWDPPWWGEALVFTGVGIEIGRRLP